MKNLGGWLLEEYAGFLRRPYAENFCTSVYKETKKQLLVFDIIEY